MAKSYSFLLIRSFEISEWREREDPCWYNLFLYFVENHQCLLSETACIRLTTWDLGIWGVLGRQTFSSLPSSKPQWTPWLPCSIYDLLWYKKRERISFLEMTFAHCWNAATQKFGPTNFNFRYLSNSLGNGTQFGCSLNINCVKLHSCSCVVSPGVCVPHKTVLKRTKDI